MSKNPHAVKLGSLGGIARAAKLSKKRRKEISKLGVEARKRLKRLQLSAKSVS